MKRNLYCQNIDFARPYAIFKLVFFLTLLFPYCFSSQVRQDSVAHIIIVGNVVVVSNLQEQTRTQQKTSETIFAVGKVLIYDPSTSQKPLSPEKKAKSSSEKINIIIDEIAKNEVKIKKSITKNNIKQTYFFLDGNQPVSVLDANYNYKNKATFSSTTSLAKIKAAVVFKTITQLRELGFSFILKSYILQFNNKEAQLFCSVFVRPPPKVLQIS